MSHTVEEEIIKTLEEQMRTPVKEEVRTPLEDVVRKALLNKFDSELRIAEAFRKEKRGYHGN